MNRPSSLHTGRVPNEKPEHAMKITQVRNATLLIHYAGTRFLIDPMLAPKGSYPGFEGMANSHLRNPLVELPLPMATLLEVDAVIVTGTMSRKRRSPGTFPCSCSIRKMPTP